MPWCGPEVVLGDLAFGCQRRMVWVDRFLRAPAGVVGDGVGIRTGEQSTPP